MIRHDVAWTVNHAPTHSAETLALQAENQALREALAAILRAGDRAARGGKLVEIHGQCVVFIGADQWQEMRRAMVSAGRVMAGERGQVN